MLQGPRLESTQLKSLSWMYYDRTKEIVKSEKSITFLRSSIHLGEFPRAE